MQQTLLIQRPPEGYKDSSKVSALQSSFVCTMVLTASLLMSVPGHIDTSYTVVIPVH
jgi:hypothetical protein